MRSWSINRVNSITEYIFVPNMILVMEWPSQLIISLYLTGCGAVYHVRLTWLMYFRWASFLMHHMYAASNFLAKMLFQGNMYNKNVLLVSQQYYFSSDSIVRISTLINTYLPIQIGTYVVDKNSRAYLLTLTKHKD